MLKLQSSNPVVLKLETGKSEAEIDLKGFFIEP